MPRHVFRGHAEGQGLQLDRLLAAFVGVASKREDFLHLLVGHRVTTGRGAGAVDHQVRTVTAVGLVEAIGITGIDRQIVAGMRVHLARGDGVEAFRRLPIAFLDLRAELARPGADLVLAQHFEAIGGIRLPDLEHAFFLEDAQHDGQFLRHAHCLHLLHDLAGKLVVYLARDLLEIDIDRIQCLIGSADPRAARRWRRWQQDVSDASARAHRVNDRT